MACYRSVLELQNFMELQKLRLRQEDAIIVRRKCTAMRQKRPKHFHGTKKPIKHS